jgi:hypothetical protein
MGIKITFDLFGLLIIYWVTQWACASALTKHDALTNKVKFETVSEEKYNE